VGVVLDRRLDLLARQSSRREAGDGRLIIIFIYTEGANGVIKAIGLLKQMTEKGECTSW
jgi:hypothetical protein